MYSRINRTTRTKSRKQTSKKTKTNTKTITNKKIIKVISYNISWESMSGKQANWELCSNNTDPTHPRHNSVCVGNIAGVLEDNPADFILLQEAENHNNLIKESPRLAKMGYETHVSGLDKMITFWNKKYKAARVHSGEFEQGRPWMAILFTNGWCVVNVHFGHYSREEEIHHLDKLIRKIRKEFANSGYNRLIVGGDFNYDIKRLGRDGILNLDDVAFYYHPRNLLTCCINRRVQNDHVIDTQAPLLDIHIPQVAYMASDHKPVLATLSC